MMIFMRNNKMMLLVLALFLLAAGCNNDNNKPDTVQPTPTSSGENAGAEVPEEVDEAAVMNDFEELSKKDTTSAELLEFITQNHTKVQPDKVSVMLVALEKAQLEQSLALEDRYYTEEGVQDKLMDLYTKDFTLPKADEVQDEALRKLLKDTEAGGYKPEEAEGSFFPVIDYERYREFQPNVTDDMKAYIDIMAVESNVAAIKDAGLTIEWDEVVKRALSMEQFLRDFPDSAKQVDMQNLFDGYTYITFQGIDNSPLFSYDEEGKILPEVKSAFLEAVKNGTDSEYLRKIGEFLNVVNENDDVQTDEVIAVQEKLAGTM